MAKSASTAEKERTLLLFSIANPTHKDACCTMAMLNILEDCFPKTHSDIVSEATHLRQAPILRAAMKFLASGLQNPEPKLGPVMQALTRCACSDAVRKLPCHVNGKVHKTHFHVDYLAELANALMASLYEHRKTPGKLRPTKPGLSKQNQPWPSSLDDLFPPHPEGNDKAMDQTLVGLWTWSRLSPGVLPLSGALALFWPPVAKLMLGTPAPVSMPMQILEQCADTYDRDRKKWKAPPTEGTAQVEKNAFMLGVVAAVQFSHYVEDIDHEAMTAAYMDRLDELVALCRRIDALISPILGDYTPLSRVKSWTRTMIEYSETTAGKMTILFNLMCRVRECNDCFYIDCKTRDPGTPLTCSGCGILRYCNAECQNAAWKHAPAPHQPLCKTIKKFRACMASPDDWNTFAKLKDAEEASRVGVGIVVKAVKEGLDKVVQMRSRVINSGK
ncbi:hypothetical protein HMN09_00351000 [Mycena chlorophos]|uniref:MYND-type domain-containing protein n=1 Tax=Mycena chlorophos TaxID=658473 RepID=A0A8H6TGS5_MYCCL|nr:hypothetical protein HMN09_00351000 [Mycena chlorophos]